jgi:mRNA-degrading endonuclease RelE of RelBE toxin-antitoxin system
MADYSVTFARSARKELERLPSSMGRRILDHIGALTKAPRPAGVIKLQGSKNLVRLLDTAFPTQHLSLERDRRRS